MTLIINGVDYSSYIQQKTGISETPRYVAGPAGGTSIDLLEIYDTEALKIDASFSLKPMPASLMRNILNASKNPPATIQYSSLLLDDLREIEGRVTLSSISYLTTTASGERIYGNSTIKITER